MQDYVPEVEHLFCTETRKNVNTFLVTIFKAEDAVVTGVSRAKSKSFAAGTAAATGASDTSQCVPYNGAIETGSICRMLYYKWRINLFLHRVVPRHFENSRKQSNAPTTVAPAFTTL